ncbi:MAG: signal peptide peptidase SppA [Gammaproteobacteria bacterium]|nr:signal peptide peptidase SppA [Gammaproteobacteria bacterium]
MQKSPGVLRRIIGALWTGVDATRRFTANALFLLVLLSIVVLVSLPKQQSVPKGAALLLAPQGEVVEQLDYVDPLHSFFGADGGKPQQTLLKDLLDAIANAKDDKRIKALVILPQDMAYASTTQLELLRAAVTDFKTSGKKVYAMADYYTQPQYYLASIADEVYMAPKGGVMLEGYHRHRLYYKSGLDKLGVNVHVFRVGTYKSAVEPYLRDDMSPEDREASQLFLSGLWEQYKRGVAESRHLKPEQLQSYVDDYVPNLTANGGYAAKLALDAKLIDAYKNRDEWREMMVGHVGKDKEEKTYKHVFFQDYLAASRLPSLPGGKDKVAVIVAKGEILDGDQPAGRIGGDTMAQLIREARDDKTVKAVVLRVDSPGGSAFASEVIRRELEVTQKAGKPLVVSMGTYAASGGYWISATADEIIAAPTTITGSIGIYGVLPTFEKPLDNWGIHSDGVGTTKLAGSLDPTRPLNPLLGEVIQLTINHGYQEFLELVAKGRNKTPQEVDAIAQGRVWIGSKALELGLVDRLGGLEDAIESAAKRAHLEDYDVRYLEKELSPKERFLRSLTSKASAFIEPGSLRQSTQPMGTATRLFFDLKSQVESLLSWNDPQHAYVHCLCEVR